MRKYIVENYADLALGGDGFCVDKALVAAGFSPFGRPWITIA